MNSCSFIGRVGRDAEVRYTQSGKTVMGWSLAVDSGYGDKKTTIWLDCSLWGERGGKLAEYVKKGSQLGVVGELGTREHDGKTYLTLNVHDVTLIGGKRDAEPRQPSRAPVKGCPQPDQGGFVDDDLDSVPF